MSGLGLRDKILYGVIALSAIAIVITVVRMCSTGGEGRGDEQLAVITQLPEPEYLYGICIDSLNTETLEVASGSTLSVMLQPYGIGAVTIDKLLKATDGIFDVRGIKAGNKYCIISTRDSLPVVTNFVYEVDKTDFIVYGFAGDSVSVYRDKKEVVRKRVQNEAVIKSSMWNAMIDAGMNAGLSMNLSDVFQWSIDFYAVQQDDAFSVIYQEMYVDDTSIGVDTIFGAWFNHGGKRHYAIRHSYIDENGDKISGYWDEEGKSLKSPFLKAPLRYSRISSTFSNARMHPVLRVVRPHHGVDYAAPAGTPVQAIGDGVIIARAYASGNGNYIKIRHSRGYQSGYLHLQGFAKGITVGSRVEQGQVIGYVGSTGISTGPHLDFRIWLNGTAINPLTLAQEKGEDMEDKYLPDFMAVRDRMIAELDGEEYIAPVAVIDTLSVSE